MEPLEQTPWAVPIDNPQLVRDARGVCVADCGGSLYSIARQSQAARIIAAAPELLALAQAFIAWDKSMPDDDDLDAFGWEAKELTALVEQAVAAVAKATVSS